MYSQSGTNQRGGEGDARPCALLRACTRAPLPGPLGIFTKSHVTVTNEGVQRVHEFLLQDQSARLLPKERVCNCLKKRIDKTKLRDIKYNEERKKKRIIQTSKDAVLCGHALSVPSKLRKNVGKN